MGAWPAGVQLYVGGRRTQEKNWRKIHPCNALSLLKCLEMSSTEEENDYSFCHTDGDDVGMDALDAERQSLVDKSLRKLLFLSQDPSALATLSDSASFINHKDFKGGNTRPGYPVIGTNLCSFRHEHLVLEWVDVGVHREDMSLQGTAIPIPMGLEFAGDDVVEEVIDENWGNEDDWNPFYSGVELGDEGHVRSLGVHSSKEETSEASVYVTQSSSFPRLAPMPALNQVTCNDKKYPDSHLLVHTTTPPKKIERTDSGGHGSESLKVLGGIPKPSFLPKGMLPWERLENGSSPGNLFHQGTLPPLTKTSTTTTTTTRGSEVCSKGASQNTPSNPLANSLGSPRSPMSPGLLLVRGLPLNFPVRQPKRSTPPSSGRQR